MPKELVQCVADINAGASLDEREKKVDSEYGGLLRVMTLEELLPMSFGPEHLAMPR